jgi:hypothetical protein
MSRAVSLQPRERRLAIGAGVVIGCWALVSWIVQPLWDRAAAARLHAGTRTERLEAIGRLLVQSPAVEREYAAVAGYFQAGDDAQLQSALLNELETLARASSIQLGLKPRPVKRQDRMSRFDVELDVEGTQEHLLTFLDALLRMPRLVAVERLRLTGVPLKPDLVRATIVLQHLSFQPDAFEG